MTLPFAFDWRNPDYTKVFQFRAERREWFRGKPDRVDLLMNYYKHHIDDFIDDWGMTFDPRNIDRGLPSQIPFILFPAQRRWVKWLMDRWKNREDGFTEKSRDMGMSWLTVGVSVALCVFYPGMAIGFGSRKGEYVDSKGAPKAFFERARFFLNALPFEFRGGCITARDSPYMRMYFPDPKSTINGEIGDGIGRGDRTALYFVDETAFLEHPLLADSALSQTTNCRQDISTPSEASSAASVAHKRRLMPAHRVFTFHWREDPRKDEAWYQRELEDHGEAIVAREIDINWLAAVENVLIPSVWVNAAVDAFRKLGIVTSGLRRGALDVADEGQDKNAFAIRHGSELQFLKSWSGKDRDIYDTVQRTFLLCDEHGVDAFSYDADGVGAGVRGDARVLNEHRRDQGIELIFDDPFQGSAEVYDPEGEMVLKRQNKNFFANLKAQSWWALRLRFQMTHRAVVKGLPFNIDDIISLDPNLDGLTSLMLELSQPTYSLNSSGKVLVDKKPDGSRSPNLADAVMMVYSPAARWAETWMKLAG